MSYLTQKYDYEGRFNSYYHQIYQIINNIAESGRVLEIGPGNGFLSEYLAKRNVEIDTLDIYGENNPTYIGSVTQIPLNDFSYDCVTAFEVLEHLPFEQFKIALQEMFRVAKRSVIISVPDVRWFISINFIALSNKRKFSKVLSFPRLTNRNLKIPQGPEDHYWEIGRPGYSLKVLKKEINSLGYYIKSDYRIPQNPIHHVFCIEKQ